MPIRPENRALYPKDWKEISARIRARAGNKCEWCGLANYSIGGRLRGKWIAAVIPWYESQLDPPIPGEKAPCENPGDERAVMLKIVRIVLTVAHLNHNPADNRDENLACLCQRCHNRYDHRHRRYGMLKRQKAASAVSDFFDGL